MMSIDDLDMLNRLMDTMESMDRRDLDEYIQGLSTPMTIYVKRSGRLKDYYEWLWDNRVMMRKQSVVYKLLGYIKARGLVNDFMVSFSPLIFDTGRLFRKVKLVHLDGVRTVDVIALRDVVSATLKELWGIDHVASNLKFELDLEKSTLKKPVYRTLEDSRLLAYSCSPVFVNSVI